MSERPLGWRGQLVSQLLLALAGLFVLLPVVWLVRLAFDGSIVTRPHDAALLPHVWSGAKLAQVWRAPRAGYSFLYLLGNSALVAGGTTAVALGVGVVAAYGFARFRFAGRTAGLFALLVLLTLPPAGLIAPFFLVFTTLKIRGSLGALILVYSAVAVPFAVWIARNAIQSVPLELEEAATLEGAARPTVFWRITLPLILPSVAVAGFTAFALAWSEFALGWAFVSDPSKVTLAMALNSMQGQTSTAWGLLAALALLVALPIVALFYVLGRYVIAGLSLGTAAAED